MAGAMLSGLGRSLAAIQRWSRAGRPRPYFEAALDAADRGERPLIVFPDSPFV